MRNVLSSLLLAWLASINTGMSSSTQLADSPSTASNQPSTYSQDSEITGSKTKSVQNYAPEDEMIIPRLRHRLREDISARLGTRGILFDKMEHSRSRRRRHGRRPPFFTESPFRFGGRYPPFGLRPPFSPYDRYGMEQFDEFPDGLDTFLRYPFSPLYGYQSAELNARPSPSYYRPQSYNRPTVPAPAQPSYYANQFMQEPQQVEPLQARPYYRGQNYVSNRRPSREQPDEESMFQPARPYYSDQAFQSNSQPPSLNYYSNRPAASVSIPTRPVPTFAGPENFRQPVVDPSSALQRQPAAGLEGVQLLRPNIQRRPMPASATQVNSEQPMQSTFQQQLQTRPNYRNESDVRLPELNTQGLPQPLFVPTSTSRKNNEQFLEPATFERQKVRPGNRDQSNVQPQALNTLRQSTLTSASQENSGQVTDVDDHHEAGLSDNVVDSNAQNVQLQPSSTFGALQESQQPKHDQDAISRTPQKTWSDQHDEIQPDQDKLEKDNHAELSHGSSSSDQAETVESKISQPLSVVGAAPQKSSKESQPDKVEN